MKVKILKTSYGSPDGMQTVKFFEGDILDLNDDLANSFIKQKIAELVNEEKKIEPKKEVKPEKKMFGGAPENKAEKIGAFDKKSKSKKEEK